MSRPVTQREIDTPEFRAWTPRLKEVQAYHRKLWEFAFVADVLHREDRLRPGLHGLGFAVGREPLPSLFASLGVIVTATDQPLDMAAASRWDVSGQYARTLDDCYVPAIVARDVFAARVGFCYADMRALTDAFDGGFDFTWSCGSFEHLGSIDAGVEFIVQQMRCLKPGGVAVHTTEYNVCSNDRTLEQPDVVVFRRRDLERLADRLRADGHRVELSFDCGNGPHDYWIDRPPYQSSVHLKLAVPSADASFDCITTSYGLVIYDGEGYDR